MEVEVALAGQKVKINSVRWASTRSWYSALKRKSFEGLRVWVDLVSRIWCLCRPSPWQSSEIPRRTIKKDSQPMPGLSWHPKHFILGRVHWLAYDKRRPWNESTKGRAVFESNQKCEQFPTPNPRYRAQRLFEVPKTSYFTSSIAKNVVGHSPVNTTQIPARTETLRPDYDSHSLWLH